MVLISIIIPIYNERRFLKDCVNSIINQTWTNLEIILVDDGSTDGTKEDCDLIAQSDKRIKVIHKENEGLSAARVTGFENSTGEWIFFIDDDDCICNNTIELLAKRINNKVDIIAGGRNDLNTITVDILNNHQNTEKSIIDTGVNICEKLYEEDYHDYITPMWGKLYKRTFLQKINIIQYKNICPTIFFEDVLMTPILYCEASQICIVYSRTYLHRIVPTSISMTPQIVRPFYLEQINSGDILLEYYKKKNFRKLYNYELVKHIKKCFRLWIIINKNDKIKYKNQIYLQLKKYKDDYLIIKHTGLNYLLFFLYLKFPEIWRSIGRVFYFTLKKMRNHKK